MTKVFTTNLLTHQFKLDRLVGWNITYLSRILDPQLLQEVGDLGNYRQKLIY